MTSSVDSLHIRLEGLALLIVFAPIVWVVFRSAVRSKRVRSRQHLQVRQAVHEVHSLVLSHQLTHTTETSF